MLLCPPASILQWRTHQRHQVRYINNSFLPIRSFTSPQSQRQKRITISPAANPPMHPQSPCSNPKPTQPYFSPSLYSAQLGHPSSSREPLSRYNIMIITHSASRTLSKVHPEVLDAETIIPCAACELLSSNYAPEAQIQIQYVLSPHFET